MVSRALAARWRACHFRAVSMSFEEASPSGTLVFNSGEQAKTKMPLQKKTSENETFISVPFLIKLFQLHNDLIVGLEIEEGKLADGVIGIPVIAHCADKCFNRSEERRVGKESV